MLLIIVTFPIKSNLEAYMQNTETWEARNHWILKVTLIFIICLGNEAKKCYMEESYWRNYKKKIEKMLVSAVEKMYPTLEQKYERQA